MGCYGPRKRFGRDVLELTVIEEETEETVDVDRVYEALAALEIAAHRQRAKEARA